MVGINGLNWMTIAFNEMGQTEVPGEGDNPRILEYHKATSLAATEDEISWCSSFVNWVMKQSGHGGTDSAAARSWLKYGESVKPRYGAITVLWRGSPDGWQGHVGFLHDFNDKNVVLLGGNQRDSVSIQAFPRSRVLDFRWPLPGPNGGK